MSRIPEELRWQGVVSEVPKRCEACSKQLTKTMDESTMNWVYICLNRNCERQGFGFMQQKNGVIIDGLFTADIQTERKTNIL